MPHSLLVTHVAQSRRMTSAEYRGHHQDLTDGAMIGLETLSQARAYLRFGSSVWCHRECIARRLVPGVAYERVAHRCVTPRRSDLDMSGK